MAKVKTFLIKEDTADRLGGVPDPAVAIFITECEDEGYYVDVTTTYIPFPSPRLTVIVTKLDHKEIN